MFENTLIKFDEKYIAKLIMRIDFQDIFQLSLKEIPERQTIFIFERKFVFFFFFLTIKFATRRDVNFHVTRREKLGDTQKHRNERREISAQATNVGRFSFVS